VWQSAFFSRTLKKNALMAVARELAGRQLREHVLEGQGVAEEAGPPSGGAVDAV
jgi:hypothetical protein